MIRLGLALVLALLATQAGAQTLTVSRGARTETVTTAEIRALPRASGHVVWRGERPRVDG